MFNHSDAAYFFSPGITGSTRVVQEGNGTTYLVGGNKLYTGGTWVTAGTLAITSAEQLGGAGDITIGNGTLSTQSGGDFGTRQFVLTHSGSSISVEEDYSSTIGGVISGNGSLNKTGAGVLFLTANNTFSGGTLIQNGTLQVGANGGGTTGSVTGNIENNAHLVFNRSDDISFGGIISGSGDVTKLGAGILTFTDINTYTGATYLNAGTLTVNGGISGLGGLVTIASGATLNGSGTINRDVTVSSGGTLSSLLVVTGQVTLADHGSVPSVSSGTVTVSSGQQLNVTNATGGSVDATAGTAQITNLAGATLNTGNWGATVTNLTSGTVNTSGGSLIAEQGDFNGTISGSGGLTKTGSGTLTLSSDNTYSGATSVNGGKLVVNGSLASSSLAIGNGTTLGGTGTIAGDTTIEGTHSPGNSPGIQHFAGNLTYSGGSSALNWELSANTAANADPAIFDTVVVAGNLSFNGITELNLSFRPVGSNVIWSDLFWQTSKTGTDGWLIYDVTGTISSFSNLHLAPANWLDSGNNSFNSELGGSSFFLIQSGSKIYLDYTFSTVTTPEPSSGVAMAVFAILGGTVFLVRRRRVQVE